MKTFKTLEDLAKDKSWQKTHNFKFKSTVKDEKKPVKRTQKVRYYEDAILAGRTVRALIYGKPGTELDGLIVSNRYMDKSTEIELVKK